MKTAAIAPHSLTFKSPTNRSNINFVCSVAFKVYYKKRQRQIL